MVNLKDALRYVLQESSCLGLQLKMGGKFLLRLNIGERPIANPRKQWGTGFCHSKSNWPWQWPVTMGESSIQG